MLVMSLQCVTDQLYGRLFHPLGERKGHCEIKIREFKRRSQTVVPD